MVVGFSIATEGVRVAIVSLIFLFCEMRTSYASKTPLVQKFDISCITIYNNSILSRKSCWFIV